MPESLQLAEARRVALAAAGFGPAAAPFPAGLEGTAAAVLHLSSVQIDTIQVVERAHHHILWSRVPRYAVSSLGRLETGERRVFEYWSHAAAYLPIGDYRYCLPRMERVRHNGHDWFKVEPATVRLVRDRIRAEGPLRVQDFGSRAEGGRNAGEDGPRGAGGWWDWKPAKVALEYLFQAGELVTVTRDGFQKRYDLAERALPPGLDRRRPTEAEMAAWYVDIATRTLGVFAARDVAYMRRDCKGGIPDEIARRVEDGRLVEIRLEGAGGEAVRCYAAPRALEAGARREAAGARAFVLSPFDPLVIDRRRLKRIFGLDYTIECYVPESKRRFGYFALPLLWRDGAGDASAVGLLDAKADRDARTLVLRRLRVDSVAPIRRSSLAASLAAELRRYAAFNRCDRLALERIETADPRLEAALRDRIESRA
jgi:hypothetical protein